MTKEWHNFQNFAEWYYSRVSDDRYETFHVDKDLMVIGNKIYSAKVCTLVPPHINSLFTGGIKGGVYYKKCAGAYVAQIHRGEVTYRGESKQSFLGKFPTKEQAMAAFLKAKIAHVKEVADKNKELLDERVYKNLTDPEWVREYILYLTNQNEEK